MPCDLRYTAIHFFMTCKLDSTLIGRDLSLQDNEFVECVVYDIQYFVKNCNENSNKSVLVFPPVNNYRRFLIHKVVEEHSQDLSTFSIGQGHARRTVVCFKRHVIKRPTLQNEGEISLTSAMGVDLDGSPNTMLSHETAPKRAKAMPAMGIYRPPAARKLEEQVLSASVPTPSPEKPRSGKTRRPDIQVYVPRAKRLEVNRKCSLGLSRSSEESVDSAGLELSENKKNQRNSRGNRLSSSNLVISAESHNSSLPSNKRKPEHNKLLTGKPVKVKHVEKKVKQDDVHMDDMSGLTEEEKIHVTSTETASACVSRKFQSDVLIAPDCNIGTEEFSGKMLPSDVSIISDLESADTREPSRKMLPSDVSIISESEPVYIKEPSQKELPSDTLIISDLKPADTREPSGKKLPSDVLIISDLEPADTREPSGKKLPSDVLIISNLEPADTRKPSGKKLPSDVLIISDLEPADTREPLQKKLPSDVLTISDLEPVDMREPSGKKLPSDVLIISDLEPADTRKPSGKKLPSDVLIISDLEPADTREPSRKKLPLDVLTISDLEPADTREPSEKKLPSDVLIISNSEPANTKEPAGKKLPSDVLIISDSEPAEMKEPSTKKLGTKQMSSLENTVSSRQVVETKTKKSEQQKREVPVNLNPDECTWDMLFDDNGDCLDPRLMEELTSAVGSVTIEKPQSDYRSYQSRVEMMLSGNAEDEFAHVLEIYNFPPDFKTHDLFTVFSPYMKNGFEIKWVDDTHALGVFSSALIAAEVLATDHPFVKTRPLHQATPESRMKARRSAEFLQPYRARPETCAALARRLVTGALGVRLRTSAEEREAERRLLREARERKRLAARQRDEAWEGTLMSNK